MLLINKTINQKKKRGSSETENRIWLEGHRFAPYAKIGAGLKITDQNDEIIIEFVEPDNTEATRTVSKRNVRGTDAPLIEINECNSAVLAAMSQDEMLRIVVKDNGIVIRANKNTVACRQKEREERIINDVNLGNTIEKGSIFSGGGTLDHSGFEGFKRSGLSTVVRFAIDNDGDCIENLATNVKHVFDSRSMLIESDISLLNVGNGALPLVHILTLTPPCVDSCGAGKAKKGNKFETSKTAHLIYHYAQIIERTNPAYILVENVPNFRNEVSFHLLTALLESWGYNLQLRVINAHEDGFSLETRSRMFLVAESKGLESGFDLDSVKPLESPLTKLGQALDYVSEDASCWSPKTGLIAKQERDLADGKGFRMQVYNDESIKIGTLRAQYQKSGSTDPLIAHPDSEKTLFRLLNKNEHARIKSLPESFVASWSNGTAHKFLGNGLDGMVAMSISHDLGLAILNLKTKVTSNTQRHELLAA
ncbi:DNA cytosine methyltransferase [Vibrio splendidus]|nr:DNA cytosine methyltransferase [Vibrio splendidus]MCC4880549.1 DNA cytosine methyltransferase [Vibrio splendidus]